MGKEVKNESKNEPEKESNYSTISIPKQLFEKIKKRCEGTGFTSTSSYVTYVLRQLISNIEQKEPATARPPTTDHRLSTADPRQEKEAFSKGDEEKVRERLKALGYIQ